MKQIISIEKEIPFKTMIGEITSISLEHTLTFQEDGSIGGDFIVSGTYKLTEASRLDEPFSYKVPVEILLTSSLEEEDRMVDIENFTYEILDEESLLIKIDLKVEGREKVEILEELKEKEKKISKIEDFPVFEELELEEEKEEFNESNEEREQDSIEEQSLEQKEKEIQEEVREEIQEETILSTNQEPSLKQESLKQAQENLDQMNDVKEEKEELPIVKDNSPQKEVMHSIFSVFKDTEETFSTYSIYILREGDTLDDVLNRYGVSKEEVEKYNHLEELKVGSKLILPTVISNE